MNYALPFSPAMHARFSRQGLGRIKGRESSDGPVHRVYEGGSHDPAWRRFHRHHFTCAFVYVATGGVVGDVFGQINFGGIAPARYNDELAS
ncbi:hypothetical protein VTI28DRAFT_6174 [Corynascus sepedonium]